jgi:hypothetical protein
MELRYLLGSLLGLAQDKIRVDDNTAVMEWKGGGGGFELLLQEAPRELALKERWYIKGERKELDVTDLFPYMKMDSSDSTPSIFKIPVRIIP